MGKNYCRYALRAIFSCKKTYIKLPDNKWEKTIFEMYSGGHLPK